MLPSARINDTCWNRDVYEPSDDTFLLADAVEQLAKGWEGGAGPTTVLELGCGSGYVIATAALLAKHLRLAPVQLVAVDHSAAAIHATQQTLTNHQVQQDVELIQCDLLAGLHTNLQGHIDLLLFNPPYVPTPDEELARAGRSVMSAWAGGHAGRRIIDKLLPQLHGLLAPGGQLLLVTVAENDPQGIIKDMEQQGFTGGIMLSRQADEEVLTIVRLKKTTSATGM